MKSLPPSKHGAHIPSLYATFSGPFSWSEALTHHNLKQEAGDRDRQYSWESLGTGSGLFEQSSSLHPKPTLFATSLQALLTLKKQTLQKKNQSTLMNTMVEIHAFHRSKRKISPRKTSQPSKSKQFSGVIL